MGRVWGGTRLGGSGDEPIGESWIIDAENVIESGSDKGKTLAKVALERPLEVLGSRVMAQTGHRFPLLIKLLDCQEWLSVQVHPNDAQARAMVASDACGKTEAWHVLQAGPDAQVIAGVHKGTSAEQFKKAIERNTILELCQYHKVYSGQTILIEAGTLHALGPGILVYEVQQSSDITYRVFDWHRPGRELHIGESIQVSNLALQPTIVNTHAHSETLVEHMYFTLEQMTVASEQNTNGCFHCLTVIEGQAIVCCGDENITLDIFKSVVVCANAGVYTLEGQFKILRSRVF